MARHRHVTVLVSFAALLTACASSQEWIYDKPRTTPAQLDRDQTASPGSKRDGERADAGANLEHLVLRCHLSGFGHSIADCRVGQEILSETMLELDAVAPEQAVELVRVRRIDGLDHLMRRNKARALALS